MRIFALSDIHVDYEVNAKWITGLSTHDYQRDILILAGDVSHSLALLEHNLGVFARRFLRVLFVPGNHDLWVGYDRGYKTSLEKFENVRTAVERAGGSTRPFRAAGVSIFPLMSWYDYSFGEPSDTLRSIWADFQACRWPPGFRDRDITDHFLNLNEHDHAPVGDEVITFSHFLPRIDLMPKSSSSDWQMLHPVLGSWRIDQQVRRLNSRLHVYGHSHVNRARTLNGVSYVNNAYGYPSETHIAAKRLVCVCER